MFSIRQLRVNPCTIEVEATERQLGFNHKMNTTPFLRWIDPHNYFDFVVKAPFSQGCFERQRWMALALK
jgi:hypothetical protein